MNTNNQTIHLTLKHTHIQPRSISQNRQLCF